jgi:transposase
MESNTTLTLGIDVGDRFSVICGVDPLGAVVERDRVRTTRAAFESWVKRPRAHLVLEVGTNSPWMSGLALKAGHEVTVVNPHRFKLISQSRKKSDVEDAELLARAARADLKLLQPVKHRPEAVRADLAVLESRELLVAERTKLRNRVRGVLKSFGVRLEQETRATFEEKAKQATPETLMPAIEPLLTTLSSLKVQIAACDKAIRKLEKKYSEQLAVLKQIPRVGTLTALTYAMVINDPTRFVNSRRVGAYLGLVPELNESGERRPELRITKAGHSMLRKLLVQVVHLMLRPKAPDTDLRRWVLRKAAGGGKIGKKKAVVAGARKLAVLMHRLWVTGAPYELLRKKAEESQAA